MATERDELSQNHTKILQAAFDEICRAAHVHSGWGPPIAYFETSEDPPRRYIYVSFGMGGIKPQGQPMGSADTVAQVLSASIATFRDWLKPNRTLVWREKPSIDQSDDGRKWSSYWRCIQLDDDAKSIDITWNF
jgi:hypothetical protein